MLFRGALKEGEKEATKKKDRNLLKMGLYAKSYNTCVYTRLFALFSVHKPGTSERYIVGSEMKPIFNGGWNITMSGMERRETLVMLNIMDYGVLDGESLCNERQSFWWQSSRDEAVKME